MAFQVSKCGVRCACVCGASAVRVQAQRAVAVRGVCVCVVERAAIVKTRMHLQRQDRIACRKVQLKSDWGHIVNSTHWPCSKKESSYDCVQQIARWQEVRVRSLAHTFSPAQIDSPPRGSLFKHS